MFVGRIGNKMATKFILVEQLDAVGMHHWCKRSLQKGEVLTLVREPDNPVDKNAVALYNQNGSEKMAYLGWSDAKRMKILMEHPNVLNRYNLMAIVTGKWEVVVWDQGPRQTCNVALQVFECHCQEMLKYINEIGLCHAHIA